MLPLRACRQRGITLIEIILVCAIVVAASAAIFVFAKKASVTAAVETEQRQVEDIVKVVESTFALQPNFGSLSTNGAEYLHAHGAARSLNFTTNPDGSRALTTGLGDGQLSLAAWDAPTAGGSIVPNSGYRLAYQYLKASECSRLVTATYPIAYQVSVDHNGLDDTSATVMAMNGQTTVSPNVVAENCAEANPTVFLYFAPARAIAGATTSAPPPAPRCNPVHETQQASCPAGQVGTITQERDGTCTGPGNTIVYTAWVTATDTCAPAPVAPTTTLPPVPPDDCTITTFSEVEACPVGQIGHILRSRNYDTCAGTYTPWTVSNNSCVVPTPGATCTPGTRSQTVPCPAGLIGSIVQSQSSICPSASGPPAWPSTWDTISNTCHGTATCQPQREEGPIPCPVGSSGPAGGSRERFRACTDATTLGAWSAWTTITPNTSCVSCPGPETKIWGCPAGSPGATGGGHIWLRRTYDCDVGAWSAYTEIANTCWSLPCTLPVPSVQTEQETQKGTQSVSCPAGQAGAITQERTEIRKRTRGASCTSAITYAWSAWSAWSGWSGTTAWVTVSNTCVVACVMPTPSTETQTENRTGTQTVSCPVGQTGAISQSRSETRTRTRSASCPTPTGSVAWTSWSAWSAWSGTTAWVTVSNTCVVACVVPTPSSETQTENRTGTQTVSCPVGQTGTISQERPETRTSTRTASCPTTTGPVAWSGWSAWSAWSATGSWVTTSSTCVGNCVVPTPSTETQTENRTGTQIVDCPAGQYGQINQSRPERRTRTRTASCPTTTGPVAWTSWGAWSTWAAAGSWVTTSNSCKTCPAATTDTDDDWEPRTQACPAGETGSHTWEELRRRTRPVTYSCPAGTTVLPAPTYGTYGGWSWTGTKRNESNTCAPATPTPVGSIGLWGSAGAYVAKPSGSCVYSPIAQYQLLTLNNPYNGTRYWYREYLAGDGTWYPVGSTTCTMSVWPMPMPYPQFPADNLPWD